MEESLSPLFHMKKNLRLPLSKLLLHLLSDQPEWQMIKSDESTLLTSKVQMCQDGYKIVTNDGAAYDRD